MCYTVINCTLIHTCLLFKCLEKKHVFRDVLNEIKKKPTKILNL